jgi:biotin carboxyl carrier protein
MKVMSELKIVGADKKEFKVDLDNSGNSGLLNGDNFEWDILKVKDNSYSVIKDNKSYNVEVLSVKPEEKSFYIKVDGIKYLFNAKDKYDELLHSLGMDSMASAKVSDLKAPMPGLVLEISVEVAQEVLKGDTLLILEAMKMENVIKSPTDGVIKSVLVNKGDTVEKNQVILNFE